VGSIWVEEGRRRSSTWSRRPAAVWTAAAPFQWVGAVVEGPGSTGELRGTRSRGWLGSRESGGRGSAAAYGGAATMAPGGGFWPFKANQGGGGRWFGGRWCAALMAGRGQRLGSGMAGLVGCHGGVAARRQAPVVCGVLVV
jgi:hypothetical protein